MVKMVRDIPETPKGPVTADIPEGDVDILKRRGWKVVEIDSETPAPKYDSMKKAELIEIAKEKGVYTEAMGKSNSNKDAIIEALISSDENKDMEV